MIEGALFACVTITQDQHQKPMEERSNHPQPRVLGSDYSKTMNTTGVHPPTPGFWLPKTRCLMDFHGFLDGFWMFLGGPLVEKRTRPRHLLGHHRLAVAVAGVAVGHEEPLLDREIG